MYGLTRPEFNSRMLATVLFSLVAELDYREYMRFLAERLFIFMTT